MRLLPERNILPFDLLHKQYLGKTEMAKRLIIAIDGPAGSGKSTVAKRIAEKLDYLYLNTGAMYRAVTLKAIRNRIDKDDEARLIKIAETCKIDFADNGAKTLLDGVDVSAEIRLPEVDKVISDIVKIPGVRRALVVQQQRIGRDGGIVTEGRDVTTVVFPNADMKIYLDASVEERARRRYAEMEERGESISFEEVKEDIYRRDKIDSSREESPLKIAEDAIVLDTTKLSIEEVVEAIWKLVTSDAS